MAANVARIEADLNAFGTQVTTSGTKDVALSSSGKTIDLGGKDGYTVLLFTASADDTGIVIVGGNGTKGGTDLALPKLSNGNSAAIVVDSAYFMDVSGTNKGMIKVKGASTTTVTCIELKAGR